TGRTETRPGLAASPASHGAVVPEEAVPEKTVPEETVPEETARPPAGRNPKPAPVSPRSGSAPKRSPTGASETRSPGPVSGAMLVAVTGAAGSPGPNSS